MWCFKCFKSDTNEGFEVESPEEYAEERLLREEGEGRADATCGIDEETTAMDVIKFVYFALDRPKNGIILVLNSISRDVQTFTVESECIEYIASITNKVFLIIDGPLPPTLYEGIEKLKQIDSVFIYSSTSINSVASISQKQHPYLVYICENEAILTDSIRKVREELDKQIAVFSLYNKKEKATRDLSKELGSYSFFQMFKNLVKKLPETPEAKTIMVTTCRNYYRGNLTELTNINDFDRNYRSVDAIPWFMKECFVYKFINKVLRAEDVDVLYQFRFYLLDLTEQLELKCLELRTKQNSILKLYRGVKLSNEEIGYYQNSIGNVIAINGYLSTTSDRSLAYHYAINAAKSESFVRVLFEYEIDLNVVKNIILADVHEYSVYPEESEFLFDFGSTFEIDSCSYNAEEDLWYIQLHATDHFDSSVSEYIEYQNEKMMESNTVLMFGNLLLEMGEYAKADRYFDTILSSLNPNDEEIACIFYNFGRVHRLKGDFNRAMNCYNRAYNLHMNARSKRSASAGKTLDGLGIVYSQQGKLLKAEECFKRALKLYKKSLPKKHVDVAGTLINLGVIDCERQNYDQAMEKFLRAKKIYNRSLPPVHPNHALLRINLGNIYLSAGQYEKALEEYESGLKLQQESLPSDHPDIARTLHNLSLVHRRQGKMELSKEYLERAEEIISQTLSVKHPLMVLINKTKNSLVEN